MHRGRHRTKIEGLNKNGRSSVGYSNEERIHQSVGEWFAKVLGMLEKKNRGETSIEG